MDYEAVRQDVKNVQLNILMKLDEICKENGLHYYLAYGTCLGALRHKGFIPWDDDIDVLMPYSDAKRLIEIQAQFGEKYFVQSRETDPDYRSISMRIRDCDTTCIEKDEYNLKINKGIYLDIYPYYECSGNIITRTWDILLSNLMKVLVNNRPPVNHGRAIAAISKGVLAFFPDSVRLKTIYAIEKHLSSVKGNEILDYYGQDVTLFTAISYPKEWFAQPKKLIFEGFYFNGPTEPEKYMVKRYGDYMKLPPLEDQIVHHSYVEIDPFKSYVEYER